ncbi:hypothetical protein B0H15DRAFT_1023172 [Mycena belliarum]|uniref:dolichol kinase n=1 Tax=Mycena belliarum TaxID=1033014 RepID=A0AAD6U630_9AGAR|nr:hypothetical protein B0H15DRAFT_1023172 [Mycena belliae]
MSPSREIRCRRAPSTYACHSDRLTHSWRQIQFTLARSRRSSPSRSPPPTSRPPSSELTRRQPPRPVRRKAPDVVVVDWSTSYQGGESSSPSRSDDDDDESDDDDIRGRVRLPVKARRVSVSPPRRPFTRSRSPHPRPLQPALSPIVSLFHRRKLVIERTPVLPGLLAAHVPLPFTRLRCSLAIDSRRAGESLVLLASLLFATLRIARAPSEADYNPCMARELAALLAAALLHLAYTYGTVVPRTTPVPPRPPPPPFVPLHARRKPDDKFGFIWMSVPKNYRDSGDDGILTALLLGPLVAAALLCCSLGADGTGDGLPPGWAIEPPQRLPTRNTRALPPPAALLRARYNLLSLATLTSAMLLLHVCASRWFEARCVRAVANGSAPIVEGERRSVPRSEGWRSLYFVLFTLAVTAGVLVLRVGLQYLGLGLWQHLTLFDVLVSALFYQFTLYVALRMAHRGLTLGELGLVCFGGTAVFMEFLNITIARIWPVTTPFIKTYRLPTPLVLFQTALIAGPFLTGFLLAPFLVLSRHAAQTPVRRQRRFAPADALRARRRLALAFYAGAVLIVFGPLGLWTRWCLGGRDPWVWALRWVVARRRRVALLAYWGALGGVSVAGWTRQLARSRRGGVAAAGIGINVGGAGGAGSGMGMGLGAGDASPTSALFAASGEFLDRAPTLGLNARRKFFHALVVVMFVPGVAFDPAFTHLAFSAAFALFVFAEYVRYFAIYPFGAAVHLFMNEFLDTKDGGTAIVSHFYLLTGCAGALWLEGPAPPLLQFTGVLVLGIGDALASIVGKRHGRHVWSPTTSKTLEGSAAFTLSVVASAWALRLCGLVAPFSTLRYVLVVALASVLEALSDQNDNLTLPLFAWSLLVLVGVGG